MKRTLFSLLLLCVAVWASAQSQNTPSKNGSGKNQTPSFKDPSVYKPQNGTTTRIRPNGEKPAPPTEKQRLESMKTQTETPQKKEVIQLVNEPGFPPYVNTGNKEKDDADYKAAKEKWVKEHPERYKEMCGKK